MLLASLAGAGATVRLDSTEVLRNLTRWYADESFYGADGEITQLAHAPRRAVPKRRDAFSLRVKRGCS